MSSETKKQSRDVAYGCFDMRFGDKLDICEKQIKQLMEIKPTEVYFDVLHTANQTPMALTWKPEIEAMIDVLSPRPTIYRTVLLNTNPRALRAKNELYKKVYSNNVKVNEREMRADG